MARLRVGPAGWTYPPGRGPENATFYPPARTRPKGSKALVFFASTFDTVEVNATFYGQPRAEVSRAWAARTPAGFEFSVKLYQKFTHPAMYKGRVADSLAPEAAGIDAGDWLEAITTPNQGDLDHVRPRI